MGWFGTTHLFFHTMRTYGADFDEKGNLKVYGDPPCFGLGGEEVLISDSVEVSINGHRQPAAGLLNSTSYGLRNVVVY